MNTDLTPKFLFYEATSQCYFSSICFNSNKKTVSPLESIHERFYCYAIYLISHKILLLSF